MGEKERDKKSLVLFFMFLAMLIVCAVLVIKLVHKNKEDDANTVTNVSLNTETISTQEVTNDQEMIYFSGFDDIAIDAGSSVKLPCDISNQDASIYMSYVITDESDNVLYESGLIEPGKAAEWIPELTRGSHTVNLHEQPYQLIDKSKEPTEGNLTPLYFVDQAIHINVN